MAARANLQSKIIDAALARAKDVGWSNVRLHGLADSLDISLGDIRRHFRDLDAIADAWFRRADEAMLAVREDAGFSGLPAKERLLAVITRWLESQSGHRTVVGEMLGTKLYAGHPHHNIALVLALSRTVQWIREAAHLDAGGRRRQIEEIGLTAVFAATVVFWLRDDSDGQIRTRKFLGRGLSGADGLMARMFSKTGEIARNDMAGERRSARADRV